jgi:hypothetical protein
MTEYEAKQQQQEQQGTQLADNPQLVKVFTGPCLFPAYALNWQQQQQQPQQQPPQQQQQHEGGGAAADKSNPANGGHPVDHVGSTSSSSSSSSTGSVDRELPQSLWQPAAEQQLHPVWLRTHGLCVVFRMDAAVVAQLCEACPQLGRNLQQLLQPVAGAALSEPHVTRHS